MMKKGKELTLANLSGKTTERTPVALFTWGYNYIWKVAGIEPWRLAFGGDETWHKAHMALYHRHKPDMINYSGAGSGLLDPRLDGEDAANWYVTDINTGVAYTMVKSSATFYETKVGPTVCNPVGVINSKADADRLCKPFTGYGDSYLNGLSRLIKELGDDVLVAPNMATSYIFACYAMGFEPSMVAMVEDPDLFQYVMDICAKNLDLRMVELRSAGTETLIVADAWSTADIISPVLYEKFCYPSQKEILLAARKHGIKTLFWDEGDIRPQLPRLSALPCDAFSSEQERKGVYVSVGELAASFKGKCIFGNLDSEELLVNGSGALIESETLKQIREAGDAPFVVFTGSPLPDDADPDRVDLVTNVARGYSRTIW